MPVTDVAANSPATSSWANSVSDAIQELEADLYPSTYGQLAIPWASITGKPTTFDATLGNVTAQTAYGASSSNGSALTASHSDHTHGTPATPTPAQVGTVASYTSPATIAGGRRLYVGPAAPTGMSEGDVWIKG
jgi:hypothetical protein